MLMTFGSMTYRTAGDCVVKLVQSKVLGHQPGAKFEVPGSAVSAFRSPSVSTTTGLLPSSARWP